VSPIRPINTPPKKIKIIIIIIKETTTIVDNFKKLLINKVKPLK
jgi:hypothetical protein